MAINLHSPRARAIAIGVVVFVANVVTSQLAWRFDQLTIDHSLETVGEVYLDGLVASIKDAVELNKPGEVDRRLKSEFTEQNGIAERLIVILDGNGTITNIAGKKALATQKVLDTRPNTPEFDRELNTLTTARQFGTSRAIAILDVAPIQSKYSRTALFLEFLSLLIALGISVTCYFVMRPSATSRAGAVDARSPTPAASAN